MLGRATASLEPMPRRWLQRVWGVLDINDRQKWRAVWPALSILTKDRILILDAGCGKGRWSLELAARRPKWRITGLDRQNDSLQSAEASRVQLRLDNVSFVQADFLDFRPSEPLDVILAVGSTHYLVKAGYGALLFQNFASWLKPNGVLIVLGPRRKEEVPSCRLLPSISSRPVFSYDDLQSLCRTSGLKPVQISARVGRLRTAAKQISRFSGPLLMRTAAYPLQVLLDLLDRWNQDQITQKSAAWLLVANK